jgi:hypothetical protein
VHHLQAEAGLVTGAELVSILREFHRDKLALRQRHAAVARSVADYDFNNTYQYVINREDQGTPDDLAEPQIQSPARKDKDAYLPLVADDARTAGEFVARWRPRVPDVSNARHRSMMGVVLGETLEQKRFFDLMTAGREDLLGRRANGPGSPGTGDGVLPVRWIE